MTGIFYGSTTGCTEQVANTLAQTLGIAANDIHNVGTTAATEVAPYDTLLLGSSTWGSGDLQDDWYDFIDAVSANKLNLYFGNEVCLNVVRTFISKPMHALTPAEDFMLGTMLGYDLTAQCVRFCKRSQCVGA